MKRRTIIDLMKKVTKGLHPTRWLEQEMRVEFGVNILETATYIEKVTSELYLTCLKTLFHVHKLFSIKLDKKIIKVGEDNIWKEAVVTYLKIVFRYSCTREKPRES